ncbi:MAG: hypothetical protein ACI4GW_14515 [Lachnospiraceae bacterium]
MYVYQNKSKDKEHVSLQKEDILQSNVGKKVNKNMYSANHNYTTLSFPAAGMKFEEKSNRQNYNCLVHTMSEMLQKYAPEMEV